MADVVLTASQQAVVNNAGGALLVSAAAGSGKTKVLVDRLMAKICDPDNPCNVDDFLVITYTKAAAAELRLKIAQALSKRIMAEPNNRHLQRQLHRIYLADISTVHAFCSNILRTYAHILDIPADFRVAEELESNLLMDRVLNALLEQGYASGNEDFLAMVDGFGYGRDDRRLPEAVRLAHEELRCRADMDGWLKKMLDALDVSQYQDALDTPWGKYLLEEFRLFLHSQIEKMESAVKEMTYYPNIQKGLEVRFLDNIAQMRQLLSYTTWDELREHQIVSFGRVGVIRKPEDEQVKERLSKVRTLCWQSLQKWQKQFFGTSADVLADLTQVTPGAQALLQFAKQFDDAYGKEKQKRKLMDFSDLEHHAIQLLTDRYSGLPTKTAKEIAGKYVEIMVDEYQDSNEVQDTIFEAVSRNGQNRFMVGDVKQSIYRFRLADPTLFLRKYLTYQHHTDAQQGEPRKIVLSENFRSRPEILSACNDVFRLIMRKRVGDLDYTDEVALKPGRRFPALPDKAVELHCLTHSEAGLQKTAMEADYVAARIRSMLDEGTLITDGDCLRPVRPGDIAILMRALSSAAPDYLAALERYGIPAVCDRGGNLMDTSEVQILISFLQLIDNPHQDIPWITALASPVFGFSPDQLAQPRTKNRSDNYYDAIRDEDAFQDVVKLVQELQEASRWMKLHDLLDLIFRKTNFLSVFAAMPDGVRRERNLTAFRSFVVSFERTESRSLAELLWYLQDLQAAGGSLPMPRGAMEDAVTLMTVHTSKGLEFPVVFLADLSKRFNRQDMQDAILVDDTLAVGCDRIDHRRFVRYSTLAKNAIIHKQSQENISEELRILYVAMTRAQDRLIMTYYSRYLLSELKKINDVLTVPLSDDLCQSVNNPGKWILMAALCRTEAGALFSQCGDNSVSGVSEHPWDIRYVDLSAFSAEAKTVTRVSEKKEQSESQGVSLLDYQYPHRSACGIPAKITATQLKGRLPDHEVTEQAFEVPRKSAFRFRRPEFLKGGLSAAEKGTATHLFMQFANFNRCTHEKELQKELNRLCLEEYLTKDQINAIPVSDILRLFRSELGSWLLKMPVQREFKFSLLVDAAEFGFGPVQEQIMLQGIVDCFVLEKSGITIIDFKTDRVPDPERYRSQLDTYGKALSRIFKVPVKKKLLYFFATGETVSV